MKWAKKTEQPNAHNAVDQFPTEVQKYHYYSNPIKQHDCRNSPNNL